jgi:hypothetical protein
LTAACTKDGDPKFRNPDFSSPQSQRLFSAVHGYATTPLPDLSLQATSGAIDAGTNLTTAVSCTGTALVVDDAGYFQDGTAGSDLARGVTFFPDWIAIGTVSNVVQINAINYDTNTITLASAKTCANGDPVWLAKKSDGAGVLRGAAPDLGAAPDQGALKPANYRYWTNGPERMFAGHTHQWQLAFVWAFDATCDTVSGACTSADYTPSASDTFVPDPDMTPPGGVQNQYLEARYPLYKGVNIGTNGNPAGYWNLFQAVAKNGTAAQQVTITTTATTRFYIKSGYQAAMQVRTPIGWPAGTHFTYYYPATVRQNSLVSPPVTDPTGYLNYLPYSSGSFRGVEISIPASATPGIYNAGWEVCTDTNGTGCTQILWEITIEPTPVLALSAPAPVALPAIYDQDTACLTNVAAGTGYTSPTPNCSWKHLVTGGAEQNGASHWCTDRNNPDTTLEAASYWLGFSVVGSSSQVTGLGWFYDAPRTWYRLAAWLNDPLWENCGRAIAARYAQVGPGAPGFGGQLLGIDTKNGTSSILGPYPNSSNSNYYLTIHAPANEWAVFPKGMEMGLARFNGGKYSSTWTPNAWNASMKNEILNQITYSTPSGLTHNSGTGFDVTMTRETGYSLEPYLAYRAAGEPLYKMVGTTPTLTDLGWHYQKQADAVASYLLMLTQPVGEKGNNVGRAAGQSWQQTGPLIDVAINYYEQTHEPRMGRLINDVLNVIKSQYDWTNHAMPWVSAPKGPWCSGNGTSDPLTKWYDDGLLGNCLDNGGVYPELDGMGAYAFAWKWKMFGDDTDRALADEMFTYSNIGDYRGPISYRWNPKVWYQVQKFAIDYLRYRLLAN